MTEAQLLDGAAVASRQPWHALGFALLQGLGQGVARLSAKRCHRRALGPQVRLERELDPLCHQMIGDLRVHTADPMLATESLRRPQIVMSVAPKCERGVALCMVVICSMSWSIRSFHRYSWAVRGMTGCGGPSHGWCESATPATVSAPDFDCDSAVIGLHAADLYACACRSSCGEPNVGPRRQSNDSLGPILEQFFSRFRCVRRTREISIAPVDPPGAVRR